MRRFLIACGLLLCLTMVCSAAAATGRVIKVLPQFVDKQGRTSLSPSLYERDAYQAQLRQHPEQRAGMRFFVEWKTKGHPAEPLRLRLELRGIAAGDLPKELTLEKPLQPSGWFRRWATVPLEGEEYQAFGEVTAWRVTLWEGKQLLGEQRSFLW